MLIDKYDYFNDKSTGYSEYAQYLEELRESLKKNAERGIIEPSMCELSNTSSYIRPHFVGPLYRNSAQFLAITAHRNAGKTFNGIKYEIEVAAYNPGCRTLIAGPTIERVLSLFLPIMNYYQYYWTSHKLGKVKGGSSSHSWELDFGDGGKRYIKLGSYAQEESLRGEHCHRIFLTECGYLPEYILNAVLKGVMFSSTHLTMEGTPSGHNVFYDRFMRGGDPKEPWTHFKLPASKSGILSQEFLDQAKSELGEALYEQEYECNFDVAIATNHIYAQLIYDIREKGQVSYKITQDCNYPVYLACDLGYADYFSCLIYQYIKGKFYFLDFYLGNRQHVSVHLNNIRAKGYNIATVFLPHDGANKSGNAEFTYEEIFSNFGYNVVILNKKEPLQVQLTQCQLAFPNTFWNEEKCNEALGYLQRARVKVGKEFNNPLLNSPVHESPFCDVAACFRYCIKSAELISFPSEISENMLNFKHEKYRRYF